MTDAELEDGPIVADRRADYYRQAGSWADDRTAAFERSRRIAWIVASAAAAIAVLEALALVLLTPLKTVEPYALLVDRETGYVQAIDPLRVETVSPDAALTRAFLAQYVVAREGFDIDSLQSDYRKVMLWSADEARDRYSRGMQAGNPASPLSALPRRAVVQVDVRSVSALDADSALVRFTTIRADASAREAPSNWAAPLPS